MLLQEQTWPTIKAMPKDTPVIIPIAAVEQHGHHMPLHTDSMLLGEIVRRIDVSMSESVLITPLMWLGNSHHHLDFGGTLSCEPRVYLDLLTSLVDNLVHHGFSRLLLLNGHGGNDVPGKQVVFEARQRYRTRDDLLLLFTTYWSLGARPWETMPEITQREMGHACEWETSMMLRIAPNLVGDYAQTSPVAFGKPFLPATRGWVTQDRSMPGHIGSPNLATVEKGEHLLATFSNDVEELLNRVLNWDGRSWEG